MSEIMHRLVDAMFGLSDDGPGALHAAIDADAQNAAPPAPATPEPPPQDSFPVMDTPAPPAAPEPAQGV